MRKSLRIMSAALLPVFIAACVPKTSRKESQAEIPKETQIESQKEIQEAGLQPFKEGTKSIDFQLPDLSGRKVALSSFKGKVVFLNFWATWCPPCRAEMPSMERLYNKLKGKGLEIVGVDLQEDAKTVRSFVEEHRLTFPILLDKDGKIGALYGARSIPTSYIIDRAGKVIAGTVGGREWDAEEYVQLFTRLLEAK